LTCANDIIFVSPYYVKGSSAQQLWESTMTQAIGRAKRWGQCKTAHAYHFATAETIDVDIIEQRNPGKMLVPVSGYSGGDEGDQGQEVIPHDQRGVLKDLGFSQREVVKRPRFQILLPRSSSSHLTTNEGTLLVSEWVVMDYRGHLGTWSFFYSIFLSRHTKWICIA
jgi:hypothetical protein